MTERKQFSLKMLGLLIVCAGVWLLINRAYDGQDVPGFWVKYGHYRANRDEYDVVFVGSSVLFAGVAPSVFDAAMAEQGHSIRSFNFGMGDVVPPESFYLVDRILSAAGGRLQCLVIEVLPVRVAVAKRDEGYPERIYWHNLPIRLSQVPTTCSMREPCPSTREIKVNSRVLWQPRPRAGITWRGCAGRRALAVRRAGMGTRGTRSRRCSFVGSAGDRLR